jgi:hypothetical protein
MENSTALKISEASREHSDSARAELVRRWLFKFALAFQSQGREPAVTSETAKALLSVWLEGLDDLSTEALEPLFRATLRTAKWFPTVAEIRTHIESAAAGRYEDEWQFLLEWIARYFHPDIGITAPKPLPPDILHAANAAGGLRYLESCSTDDLVWAKKRFIEDLARQRTTEETFAALPESELGKMLREHSPKFALPPAPQSPKLSDEEMERTAARLRARDYAREPNAPPDPKLGDVLKKGGDRWRKSNERACEEWRRQFGVKSSRAPVRSQRKERADDKTA